MQKHKEHGQSLILVAFGIFALIAFVGLGVDLGMMYIARVKTRRAADAAALAAASELPLEALAQMRALEYLAENDYDCGVGFSGGNFSCAAPDVRVEINDNYASGPAANLAATVIELDTVEFREPEDTTTDDTSNKIRVSVTENVPVIFFRLFGFGDIPVTASSVAENINDLDLVLVFDKSGSMEFDTLCYGCWSPVAGQAYPEGQRWPLPWEGPANGLPKHCSGQGNDAPYTYNGDEYIVIEAEDYSNLSNPYNRDLTTLGDTYWVLGRNTNTPSGSVASWQKQINWNYGAGALGRDPKGAYLSYHPGNNNTGVTCNMTDLTTDFGNGYPFPEYRMCNDNSSIVTGGPRPSPRVDYEFTVPDSGTWYVWLRGQGGQSRGVVYWGLSGSGISNYSLIGATEFRAPDGSDYKSGTYADGANASRWGWERLGGRSLSADQTYTLHLWGGTPGFDADRIVITDNNDNPESAGSGLRNNILNNTNPAVFDDNRTGKACNPCDARYGGFPGGSGGNSPPLCSGVPNPNRYLDDIYDDEQPIRDSVEAAKRFVRRMDPQFDQIGYVTYSSSASINSELECVRRLGHDACTEAVLENNLITAIDNTHASGSTNIAHGIDLGINVLSNQPGHFGRPAAAKIMIVMTDGEANTYSGVSDSSCADDPDLWPGDTQKAKDCMVYYALKARSNGIIIFSITLGEGADTGVMEYIANLTGGIHRHAPRAEQLDPIFDELYSRIFLRLTE